jgi:hypothetical protein
MAMNRNRRRSGESTATGFWSTFMGRNQERRPSDHEFSQEPDPMSEPPAAVGQWQWEDVSRHIPFILYCTFLLLIYIANGHSQESMQRKILSTRQEVEDLKAEYILLQSEVMHLGRRTEVLSRLQNMGMGWKIPQEPPVVLDADYGATNAKKKGT